MPRSGAAGCARGIGARIGDGAGMMSDAIVQAVTETELKLLCSPADLAALRQHKRLRDAFAGLRPRHLRATYYDTPDLRLRAAGFGLRLRRDAATGAVRQTLKAAAAGAGLFQRDEWESAVAGEHLDRDALAATPLADILETDDPAALLQPVFVVEAERLSAPVRIGDAVIEVTLDEGAAIAGSARTAICEVELELVSGKPRDLFALARKLASKADLRPGLQSKAETGYALVTGARPAPVKAFDAGLHPDIRVGEAFRAIARASLRQVLANEPALVQMRDPAAVHQMRVGLRRLRAAVALFRPAIRDRYRKAITAELRWLARSLGDARELDVFLGTDVARMRRKRPGSKDTAALAAHFEDARAQAYAHILEILSGPRYRALLFDTLAWIEAGPWQGKAGTRKARAMPVALLARDNLARRSKDVRRRARILSSLEVDQRHALRLDVKKLRYAAEFFAPVFAARDEKSARRAAKFVTALAQMQERLGELNDAATSLSLTGRLDRNDEAGRRAAKLIEEDHVGRAAESLAAARDACAAFIKAKPFWKERD